MERHEVFRSDRIKVTERLITQHLPTSVLEIGAGDYSFDYLGKKLVTKWTKVDFSPPADIICDINKPSLELSLEDASYELVIATEILEHLLWPQALLTECKRLLKPGGCLLVSVPNIVSLSYRVAWMFGRIPSCAASGNLPPEMGSTTYKLSNGSLVGGHVVDFNASRLVALLQATGFHVLAMKGCGIIWHRQLLPFWSIPAGLSSNLICLAKSTHVS